jgi:hypothetical protein
MLVRRPCTIAREMQGRLSLVIAGFALAAGGGVAGAVVVAPSLQSETGSIAVRQAAGKEALATPQHTFHVAKKARGMARGARQVADQAQDDAAQAQDDATRALSDADVALSRLNSMEIAADAVNGQATTSSPDYERDPSSVGPRVTVTVPQSGFIEVWASVHVDDVEGAVGLFEDGQLVTLGDQIGGADCGADHAILGTTGAGPVSLSTPPSFDGSGLACGTIGNAPAPILLNRPPGEHTYELRYADCGCFGGPSTFSERTLRVAPRL